MSLYPETDKLFDLSADWLLSGQLCSAWYLQRIGVCFSSKMSLKSQEKSAPANGDRFKKKTRRETESWRVGECSTYSRLALQAWDELAAK